MDHVQDELKTQELFLSIADSNLEAPDDDYVKVTYHIVTKCLVKHSARPSYIIMFSSNELLSYFFLL